MMLEPNLVLIGFMATGKSTVGRDCARILGLRYRDSDRLVERRAGKSVAAVFAEDGEAAFRGMETSAIRTLAAANPIVLSTGGGAPMDPANVECLKRTGFVVLLWAEPDAILARVGNPSSRPLLSASENPETRIRDLLAQRESIYRAAADAIVDTTSFAREETVERVLAEYRGGKALGRFRRSA
jgi:shikimate kinase